jgi:purine-binding chemotaxis protein CheW
MDFLKIRRKAKERAAQAATTAAPAPAGAETDRPGEARPAPQVDPGAGPASPPPGAPRVDGPEARREESELGSRVAALPRAPDSRFVAWRPDGGPLPELAAVGPPEGEYQLLALDPTRLAVRIDPLEDFFYRDDEIGPELGAMVAAEGQAVVAPAALQEYLTFRLGGETYAVEIARVLEVLRTPSITEVPRAPGEVLGIISLRGEVITVIDPRGRLGLGRAEGSPARRVLIVDDGEGTCGLLIDEVVGVVRLPGGALEPCPQALTGAGADLFLGIGRERDRLFLVLDVGALLRPLRRAAEATR